MKNTRLYLFGTIIITLIIVTSSYLLINNYSSLEIKIVGSTTVQPVAQSLSQAYMKKHPEVKITVQGGDSMVGIKSVQSGLADIGTASRNLSKEESKNITQYQIGKDGVAVIVNPENPINSLTMDQLREIYEGKITNWKQVGGKDEPITVIIREAESGTRLAFEDILFGKGIEQNNANVAISTYQVMQDVAADSTAIGYVSRNSINSDVKLLMIDNVSLTKENVENGRYVLQRPLIFLVKGTTSVVVKDFLDFVMSPEGQLIVNSIEYKPYPSSESQVIGIGPGGGI